MLLDRRINIDLRIADSGVQKVNINSNCSSGLDKLLVGKSIYDVNYLLGVVYSICRTAHQLAFLRLLHNSNVIQLSPNEVIAYELLLYLENIGEHCFSIATKWKLADDKIDKSIVELISLLKDVKKHVFVDVKSPLGLEDKIIKSGSRIRDLIDDIENKLVITLLGKDINPSKLFSNLDIFNLWVKNSNTIASKFLNYISKKDLADIGNIFTNMLPDDIEDIKRLLERNEDIRTSIDLDSRSADNTFETTAFSRQMQKDFINLLSEAKGQGLFTRAVSRLVEIFDLLTLVRKHCNILKEERVCYKPSFHKTNAIAMVEASRGLLVHKASFNHDLIEEYKIVSPTDWNFSKKNGIVNRMIFGLPYSSPKDISNKVKLLVDTVDPCIDYDITVSYA